MTAWYRGLRGRVRRKELLRRHTTLRIGGPARFFIEPRDKQDLRLLLKQLKRYKMPLFLLGAGSNILASDKGIPGVVVRLSSAAFKRLHFKDDILEAGAGVPLRRIIRFTQEHGMSGTEFLVGIPGTIGGALVMNAGIPARSIADLVQEVTVMDYDGNIKTLQRDRIGFGYRYSDLSGYIILTAKFRLRRDDKRRIKARVNRCILRRKLSQDVSYPNAGCIFKNPPGHSAGRLIDLCGLKGTGIGGASVSLKHANFILNRREAKAGDVLKLMRLIREKVQDEFNIALEPEIRIWR